MKQEPIPFPTQPTTKRWTWSLSKIGDTEVLIGREAKQTIPDQAEVSND